MMSEHLAGMNEKLTTQKEEIDMLKYQLNNKVRFSSKFKLKTFFHFPQLFRFKSLNNKVNQRLPNGNGLRRNGLTPVSHLTDINSSGMLTWSGTILLDPKVRLLKLSSVTSCTVHLWF